MKILIDVIIDFDMFLEGMTQLRNCFLYRIIPNNSCDLETISLLYPSISARSIQIPRQISNPSLRKYMKITHVDLACKADRDNGHHIPVPSYASFDLNRCPLVRELDGGNYNKTAWLGNYHPILHHLGIQRWMLNEECHSIS